MTDSDLLKLLASPGDDFARGLVQLGWFDYQPTLSKEEYQANARSVLNPRFDSAGRVGDTQATVLRLTLNDGEWQDAVAIFESHLRRRPQFAVCFCNVGDRGLMVMTLADPGKAVRKASMPSARIYLDLARPGNYENEIIQRLRQARKDNFAKALQGIISVERVTKKFYEEFKKKMKAFAAAICGEPTDEDRKWYASVLLNRLMFIYFIQSGGMMPEPDYLKRRLGASRGHFYKDFLLPLFFEGLGAPEPRPAAIAALLGKVPYLDGGIFQRHELEERYPELDVPDAAFQDMFAFFDAYTWRIDDRPMQSDRQINPDVLGYIFEKYVNQKQMGAYYTKEDITEYISKNTIIPFLFDRVLQQCPPESTGWEPWELLQTWPQDYIYPAVQKGVLDEDGAPLSEELLPDWVRKDMAEPRARMYDKRYNLGAAEYEDADGREYHLPTETWREYAERRARCLENYGKMQRGEVKEINDLITLNLDIRRFAEDAIVMCDDPVAILAWYEALSNVSVLDPTCGSGAFLFAAVNILEPLYRACLTQMGKHRAERKEFGPVLDEIARHPNRRCFILKAIILNNLYGVDIEKEAVEICKLRLFLKLAGHAEPDAAKPNYGVEPLPDIDFNIRAGNTLVGYATEEQAKTGFDARAERSRMLDIYGEWDKLKSSLANADVTFKAFREAQTGMADASAAELTALTKEGHYEQLDNLNQQCNRLLATEYSVNPDDAEAYSKWLDSHKPFHWFVEFHDIMHRGGFDVIIGNPPYLSLTGFGKYQTHAYTTQVAKNLYPLVVERGQATTTTHGRSGYIVPISSISTDGYATLQALLTPAPFYFAAFDDRPSRLFDGLEHIRLAVALLGPRRQQSSLFSTRYHKWTSLERSSLFQRLRHTSTSQVIVENSLPKLCHPIERSIQRKLARGGPGIGAFVRPQGLYEALYSRKVGYFLQVLDFRPLVTDRNGAIRDPSEFKSLSFGVPAQTRSAIAALNSSLFYWFLTIYSDCRHLNRREIEAFPLDLDKFSKQHAAACGPLVVRLMARFGETSTQQTMAFTHDRLTVQCIRPKYSKPIIDQIDEVLARHYGFTDEELDFIINYDIKYRMGNDGGGEDDAGEAKDSAAPGQDGAPQEPDASQRPDFDGLQARLIPSEQKKLDL